jgi:small subunit ribosomal protein S16
MLKIKLARIGKKAQPQYHIVVVEDKTNSGTRSVDQIGYYNPLSNPKEIRLDIKSYESWMSKGARPTDTVKSLATKYSKTLKTEKPTKTVTKK